MCWSNKKVQKDLFPLAFCRSGSKEKCSVAKQVFDHNHSMNYNSLKLIINVFNNRYLDANESLEIS